MHTDDQLLALGGLLVCFAALLWGASWVHVLAWASCVVGVLTIFEAFAREAVRRKDRLAPPDEPR